MPFAINFRFVIEKMLVFSDVIPKYCADKAQISHYVELHTISMAPHNI